MLEVDVTFKERKDEALKLENCVTASNVIVDTLTNPTAFKDEPTYANLA